MSDTTAAAESRADDATQSQADTTTDVTDQTHDADTGAQAEAVSADEIRKVRREAQALRRRLKDAEDELRKRQDAEMTEAERLKKRLDELEKAEQTWKAEKSELLLGQAVSNEATKAGALYPDLLIRSLDRSAIEYDDDGNPTNLPKVVAELKKAYPALFRAPAGSADGGAGNESRATTSPNDLIRRAAGRA